MAKDIGTLTFSWSMRRSIGQLQAIRNATNCTFVCKSTSRRISFYATSVSNNCITSTSRSYTCLTNKEVEEISIRFPLSSNCLACGGVLSRLAERIRYTLCRLTWWTMFEVCRVAGSDENIISEWRIRAFWRFVCNSRVSNGL